MKIHSSTRREVRLKSSVAQTREEGKDDLPHPEMVLGFIVLSNSRLAMRARG